MARALKPPLSLRLVSRVVRVSAGEGRVLLLASAYFFTLMASYAILRPLRDALVLAGGERSLPWLFLGTLAAMALVNPLFAALVARTARRTFVPAVAHVSALTMVAFCALLRSAGDGPRHVAVAGAFFVWVSVFNLFTLSVFWGLMADIFRPEQGLRLFGFIGVGGTLGAVAGSLAAATLAERVGPVNLLLASAALLEVAAACAGTLLRACPAGDRPAERPRAPPAWEGARLVVASPYLLGICAYLLLFTVTSTLLYFQQAHLVSGALGDTAQRTALFARVDLAVNVATVIGQCLLTSRALAALGVATALALLPAVTFLGFAGLGVAPSLGVLVAFQIARRTTDYVLARPGREVLFTVVPRDEKYQAKSLIDTLVYRGGDALGAWAFGALRAEGSAAVVSLLALPLCVLWGVAAVYVGRRHGRLAAIESGGWPPTVSEPGSGRTAPAARIARARPPR